MATEQLHIALPERYRALRRVATGGMATVYAACDELLSREVAVKVLSAALAADESSRARFTREARAAARVSDHPNVVTIYDIGETDGEPPAAFIVMELLTGGTIHDRLRAGEPIPHATALSWLRDAAAALDAAHAAGMVHRDVKPANLLLDATGTLKVADFGIARLADDSPLTMTGQVVGTASYFAPEQALGKPATEASDRYALAVVAFELLTGKRPFPPGPPAVQARAHVETEPPRASEAAPGLPPAVDAVLARGMAKEPEDRLPSCAELVDALEGALGPTASTGMATPSPTPVIPRRPRTPTPTPLPEPEEQRFDRAAAAAAPPPRPPRAEAPSTARSDNSGSRAGFLAILAAVVLLAGAGFAAILAGGGDGEERASSPPATSTPISASDDEAKKPRKDKEKKPAAAAPTAPEETAAPQGDPAAIQLAANQKVAEGDYDGAIAMLGPMLESCPVETTSPCAYGWYDYGVALLAAGRAEEAVSALEIRAQNPDQAETVQAKLAEARAAAGESG